MTNTTYDALGRPVRQFAPALEGFQWGFSRPTGWDTRPNTLTEYDMAGRVFRVTEPSGVQTHHYFATDGAGYIVSTVDGRGHATHKVTDGLGRLTRSRTFSGGWNAWTLHAEQRYAYDAMDNLLWTRNEANHATTVSMGYDWLGRKTSMNDPSMGAWTYGYDLNGNLTRQTDARGIVLTFSYDALNRKTAKVQGSTTLASWGYDETNDGLGNTNMQNTRGRLTSTLVNGDNWRRWYYDARGRVTMDRRCVTGSTPDCLFTTQYAYDSADRVTSMTYPNGEVVTTGYNDAMEPVSLAGTSSYVSGATYNALGLLNGMNHGNTTATRYYYYGSNLEHTAAGNSSYGRLRRICVSVSANGCADDANAAGALFKMAYAYDAVGNITNMGDRTLGQGLAYSYDAQDRLVSWSIGGTTQETYSYDVLGRMTNRSTLGTFSYGHASKVHAVTGVGAGTFSYDANGNMLSRWQSGTTFTQEWNADNKASRVHGGGQDIRYFYDADGVLVRRTSGGVTTVFVGPHAEWRSDTGWTNYYHFNGQRVAMRNSAGVFWLHGDHLGSASLITTNAGATSGQLRYDPWGQRRVATGNIWTEYTFTDQRQELSIGLMDYDARLYSPVLARFISPDSIVPDKKNVLDFNRYAYVRHNPMRYTDPTGHEPKDNCSYAGVGCGPTYDLIQAGMQASTASQVVRWMPWFAPTLASWMRQGSVIASALHRSSDTNGMALRLLFQAGSAAGRHVLPSFNLEKSIQGMAGPGLGFEFSIGVNGNNPLSYFAFNLSISDGRIVMDSLGWSIAGVEYALGPAEFSLTLSNPFDVDLPGGYNISTDPVISAAVFGGRVRSGRGTQSTITGDRLRVKGLYELSVNVGILFFDVRDPVQISLPAVR